MAIPLFNQKKALEKAVKSEPKPAEQPSVATFDSGFDPLTKATGALNHETYFPSASNNIVKGSYSGPNTGSSTAYAPGGLMPWGVFDARQAELKAAKADKAKAVDDFMNKFGKPPQTERTSVQADIDQEYYSGLTQWLPMLKQRYGSDWAKGAATDLQFQNWNENMTTKSRYNDSMVEMAAQIDAWDKDPNKVVSQETKAAAAKVMTEMSADDPLANHNLGTSLFSMQNETDLDMAVNEALDNYAADTYSSNTTGGGAYGIYDVWQEVKTFGMSDDEIKSMAHTIWTDDYGGQSNIYTEERIQDRLRSLYPQKVQKTLQFQGNASGMSGSGDNETVFEESSISTDPTNLEYKGSPNGVIAYDQQTLPKGATLDVPNNTNAIDPKTGQRINIAANSKLHVQETFNILVTNSGAPVAGGVVPAGQNPNDYHYELYAAASVDVGSATKTDATQPGTSTSKTQKVSKTIWTPMAGLEGGVTTTDANGNYKKGLRTDIQKKRAGDRTTIIRSGATQPAADKTQGSSTSTPSATHKTQAEFDSQWAKLPSGGTLVGPDGITYTKK